MSEGRFHDFDAADEEDEPISFRLGGREWTAAHLNATNFLRYGRQNSDARTIAQAFLALQDYILSVLAEDDREAFAAMLADRNVKLSTLRDAVDWLVKVATGIPFDEPASSQPPQRKTGGRPRVVSLSGATTSDDSASAAG